MKANFEKGTKICCSCKKELSLDMFYKDKVAMMDYLIVVKIVRRNELKYIIQVTKEKNK